VTHHRPDHRHEGDLRCFGIPTVWTVKQADATQEWTEVQLRSRLARHGRPGVRPCHDAIRLERTDETGIIPDIPDSSRVGDLHTVGPGVSMTREGIESLREECEREELAGGMGRGAMPAVWWACVWDSRMGAQYHQESMALEDGRSTGYSQQVVETSLAVSIITIYGRI
jgi:hypothetical protein